MQRYQGLTTCVADKGYESDELRMEMLRRGYVPIIGYRKNRKERVKTDERIPDVWGTFYLP